MIGSFLNPEGHQKPLHGSKVTAILPKGRILPIGGVASGRVCACRLRSRLALSPLVSRSAPTPPKTVIRFLYCSWHVKKIYEMSSNVLRVHVCEVSLGSSEGGLGKGAREGANQPPRRILSFHRIGPTGPIWLNIFRGLSLALGSHDQFKASHWSTILLYPTYEDE